MPCTTILVGKKASYDGSTIIARNEDSGSLGFCPKRMRVVTPEEQPRHYVSVLSHVAIDLPDNPLRYTSVPNALDNEGIWAEAGVNSANVAMSATETLTTNERVRGADPFVVLKPQKGTPGEKDFEPEVPGGIGEEDMVTLVLPYITSAREGVLRLGELLQTYGTYEMNGIAFSDVDEIWWLETVGGHHWIARRVPDDVYVTMPNQLGLDSFDLEDALGEQKDHLCSPDLKEFIEKNHLDLSLDGKLNPRDAFGSHSDSDHVYNTPRAWAIQRFLNPHSNIWDGEGADFRPEDDDIPWCRTPERKVTIEDVKYALSLHYQGTPYDPYAHYGNISERGKYRPIGINRNGELAVIQLRPYEPEASRAIQWMAFGSNVFNALVALYANVDHLPEYLTNTTDTVSTESFYWQNRLIAALADAHFRECNADIERYQQEVPAQSYEILAATDQEVRQCSLSYQAATPVLEAANKAICQALQRSTDKLLAQTLNTASLGMQNSFSKEDA
ncbi:MAG: C69 family dipeptidase [Atopobiaceae bacterium]